MNNRHRRGRPCSRRRIAADPRSRYFKPRGIPLSALETVALAAEELEAVRLKNLLGLDQRQCARRMDTSPATLQRLLSAAYYKIAIALTEGKAIRIEDRGT